MLVGVMRFRAPRILLVVIGRRSASAPASPSRGPGNGILPAETGGRFQGQNVGEGAEFGSETGTHLDGNCEGFCRPGNCVGLPGIEPTQSRQTGLRDRARLGNWEKHTAMADNAFFLGLPQIEFESAPTCRSTHAPIVQSAGAGRRDRRRASRGPCHPPLDEGLIIAAERAMPARKPSVKIKVASTIRALPSPCTIEIDVFLRNAHEPVLLAIVLYSRRTRPLLSQIIAPRVVLSPLGNGRAHLTICNAEMAWWCRHGNALI